MQRPAAGSITRVHEDDAWVEPDSEPSRGEMMKVKTLRWHLLAQNPCFLISLYFWLPDFTLLQVLKV